MAAKDGAKVTVKKTGGKQGSEDKWEVVESSVKIDKLDDSVPNGIVVGARGLESERLRRRRSSPPTPASSPPP